MTNGEQNLYAVKIPPVGNHSSCLVRAPTLPAPSSRTSPGAIGPLTIVIHWGFPPRAQSLRPFSCSYNYSRPIPILAALDPRHRCDFFGTVDQPPPAIWLSSASTFCLWSNEPTTLRRLSFQPVPSRVSKRSL